MPLAKNISPYRAVPKVKPFNPDEFVSSLASQGPQLTSTLKGDWEALYRRFFKCPNFVGWYNQRHREVSQKLQLLHLESLSEAKIEHWMAGKEEVQLVDMVLRIRNKLEDAYDLPLPDIIIERLSKHIDTIVKTLPADLQTVLLKGSVSNEDDTNRNDPVPDQQQTNTTTSSSSSSVTEDSNKNALTAPAGDLS